MNNVPQIPLAFTLNAQEVASPLFQKLLAYWEEQLANAREQNDHDLDPVKTARVRGRIDELKRNIGLTEPTVLLEAPVLGRT